MTDVPERIWLQQGGPYGEDTFCEDQINNDDVEYIRAYLHQQALRDRIAELEAELNLMKTSGIIEVATRNPNVMEYMRHWEDRAEAAEAKLANGDGEARRAWFAYVSGCNRIPKGEE